MTTWTQDYPALPGSADAAAVLADTVVAQHLPRRSGAAGQLVRGLFVCALAKTEPVNNLNLVTVVGGNATERRARFELHYRNDVDAPDAPGAHEVLSRLADAYGERRTRSGSMIYAELWDQS